VVTSSRERALKHWNCITCILREKGTYFVQKIPTPLRQKRPSSKQCFHVIFEKHLPKEKVRSEGWITGCNGSGSNYRVCGEEGLGVGLATSTVHSHLS